jgi:hypothetical protein
MFYNRLAVDFDDTIFKDAGTIEETYNNLTELEPIEGAAYYTNLLHQEGFEIVIHTCRPDYHRKYLEDQFTKHGIYHDYILFYTKPRVDCYIDNKAIHFTSWKKAYQEVHLRKRASLGLQQPFTPYEKALQKVKIKHLRKTEKVILDVGCGDGSVFEGTEYRVHGIEPNDKARDLCYNVSNYERTIFSTNLDLKPYITTYEIVTILGVLEHIDDPLAFLKDYSSAKEIYITVPNAMSFHRIVGFEVGIITDLAELVSADVAIGHKHYFSPHEFRKMLQTFCNRHGYKITAFGTVGFKIAANVQMEQFSDIALHLDAVSEQAGLTGNLHYLGAEIFANLVKR